MGTQLFCRVVIGLSISRTGLRRGLIVENGTQAGDHDATRVKRYWHVFLILGL